MLWLYPSGLEVDSIYLNQISSELLNITRMVYKVVPEEK